MYDDNRKWYAESGEDIRFSNSQNENYRDNTGQTYRIENIVNISYTRMANHAFVGTCYQEGQYPNSHYKGYLFGKLSKIKAKGKIKTYQIGQDKGNAYCN
jgi:hypothetical protein